jgi:hypothetical protein
MTIEFVTLPDDADSELQSVANLVLADLRRRGYRCTAEPYRIELPATPTILAKRKHGTNYVLIRQNIDLKEVNLWLRFAQSGTKETHVTVCCPASARFTTAQLTRLKASGIALWLKTEDNRVEYVADGRDLAFHATPPDRVSLKPRVRSLLGESLDRLDRGDWRAAFEDACVVLEEQCRSYLLARSKLNRVKYQEGSSVKILTEKQIKKMTLGALKDTFCKMISQNQIEASLCAALRALNPDRVKRVHRRSEARTEDALRRRVGPHFWLISNALSLLV